MFHLKTMDFFPLSNEKEKSYPNMAKTTGLNYRSSFNNEGSDRDFQFLHTLIYEVCKGHTAQIGTHTHALEYLLVKLLRSHGTSDLNG